VLFPSLTGDDAAMRRLLPTVRSFIFHSGQAAALGVAAVLAMAFAPMSEPSSAIDIALPEAPPVTAIAVAAAPMTRMITFDDPVIGYEINSNFGLRRLPGEAAARRHEGIDIAAPQGTTVLAAAEGKVLRSGYQPTGYGRFIEVEHPNGMTTLYAHLSRVDVASGDRVSGGERIGLVGTTGRSTGPHLHFEVKRNHQQVNPTKVLGQSFEAPIDPAAIAQA